jgi:hypothetical protein
MDWFALPVTRPSMRFKSLNDQDSLAVLAASELGKREYWRFCKRWAIGLSSRFPALWRGYGRWILRRNAGDGSREENS